MEGEKKSTATTTEVATATTTEVAAAAPSAYDNIKTYHTDDDDDSA